MKIVNGNLITLAKQGEFDVIVHGSNCYKAMGAGIALEIRGKYHNAWIADQKSPDAIEDKIGRYSFATSGPGKYEFTIINAYTQKFPGYNPLTENYQAIRDAFTHIRTDFGEKGLRFGIPRIGAGLAGGNWDDISKIIDEVMDGEDITLVEWDGSL